MRGSRPTSSTFSEDAESTSGLHIAFQATDRETVERFYDAALTAGGRDNGVPGERSYHPGYYGAYVLDPVGTNVEAVYHGPAERSAPSVVFRWDSKRTERSLASRRDHQPCGVGSARRSLLERV
jgi:Glyoxalase/Bleomycin resistance protein/Dioxygenase superfamily